MSARAAGDASDAVAVSQRAPPQYLGYPQSWPAMDESINTAVTAATGGAYVGATAGATYGVDLRAYDEYQQQFDFSSAGSRYWHQ